MEQESKVLLEFDNKVRAEASKGFQQIRIIKDQLGIAPRGILGKADGCDAQAVRNILLSASVTIVGSFNKVISLLSAPPSSNSSSSLDHNAVDGAESILSTSHTSHDRTPPQSPILMPPATSYSAHHVKNCTTSPACSPCHTPHSGSGMSEGSPPNPSQLNLESDGEAATPTATKQPRRSSKEPSASADPELSEQRALCRKRKFMPKYSCKQPASGADPGNDAPPNDGHTWRKYGQKDILGSRFPRSYYRCTHKTELGCVAIKYVQRSDEEPSIFDVTYRGNHTCQFSMHQPAWPFPFSPNHPVVRLAFPGRQQLPPSDPNSSSAMLNYLNLGSNPMNNAPGASQTRVAASAEDFMCDIGSGFPPLRVGGTGEQESPGSGNHRGVELPMISNPPISDISTSSVMTSSFGLSTRLMEMDIRFSTTLDGNNASQQPVHILSRSPRDHVFENHSAVMKMQSQGPRPGLDERHTTFLDDPSHGRVGNNVPHAGELGMSDSSVNSGPINRLLEAQYVEAWEQDHITDSDAFPPSQLDAEGTGRYSNDTQFILDFENPRSSPNIHTSSVEMGQNSVRDTSVFTSGPLQQGFADGSVGFMDYDHLINSTFLGCA